MYCMKCGTNLPDEANFCFKCGQPQNESVSQEQSIYEICEIVWTITKNGSLFSPGASYYFWAKAIGPSGTYKAAESPVFENGDDPNCHPDSKQYKKAQELFDGLTNQLVKDGWEFTETFGAWWQKRFRRRVKSEKNSQI